MLSDSTAVSVLLKDDGDGNLYDNAYSASYVSHKSGSHENGKFDFSKLTHTTGSVVGNVFYDHGVIVITDTGSRYVDVAQKRASDGYSLKYKATQTIYEHEYTCIISYFCYLDALGSRRPIWCNHVQLMSCRRTRLSADELVHSCAAVGDVLGLVVGPRRVVARAADHRSVVGVEVVVGRKSRESFSVDCALDVDGYLVP